MCVMRREKWRAETDEATDGDALYEASWRGQGHAFGQCWGGVTQLGRGLIG